MPDELLTQFDNERKQGYRPSVLINLTCKKKLLVFFAKEYQQWVFPQTGIENGETFETTLMRLLSDEVGEYIIEKLATPLTMIGEKKSDFPNRVQGSKDLRTDSGDEVTMIGKKYYIFTAELEDESIDITKSQFSDFWWFNEKEARFAFENMLHINKKEVLLFALETLKQKGFVE
jgi:8-oxo-dGTP pyrophosphatase MutT (NUDIX family)